jgi:hypothetical protein
LHENSFESAPNFKEITEGVIKNIDRFGGYKCSWDKGTSARSFNHTQIYRAAMRKHLLQTPRTRGNHGNCIYLPIGLIKVLLLIVNYKKPDCKSSNISSVSVGTNLTISLLKIMGIIFSSVARVLIPVECNWSTTWVSFTEPYSVLKSGISWKFPQRWRINWDIKFIYYNHYYNHSWDLIILTKDRIL